MRNGTKIIVALVALALGGALVGSADAGNAQIASAEYFSLAIGPGGYISYTGTDPDATLLVDDLTFAADLDVCDLDSRCVLFEDYYFGVPIDEMDSNATGSIGSGNFFTNSYHRILTRFVEARGEYYRATVSDVNTSNVGPAFDAFSHNVYAYLAMKSRDESASFERFVSTEPAGPMGPVLQHSASGSTHAIAEAIAITSWAVPTSESRHYQTPHIIQNDRILFTVVNGYTGAVLYVKGRVILEAADVPVVNGDVQ